MLKLERGDITYLASIAGALLIGSIWGSTPSVPDYVLSKDNSAVNRLVGSKHALDEAFRATGKGMTVVNVAGRDCLIQLQSGLGSVEKATLICPVKQTNTHTHPSP